MEAGITSKLEISREWTIRKLLFAYSQIQCGFYQSNGYMLLENPNIVPRKYMHKVVQIPQVLFDEIVNNSEFRSLLEKYCAKGSYLTGRVDVSEIDRYINDNCPKECNEVFDCCRGVKKRDFYTRKSERELRKVMKFLGYDSMEFTIYPSLIGTGSFNQQNGLRLFPRFDTSKIGVFSMLMGVLIRKKYKNQTWESYMSIQRFLLMQTEFGKNLLDLVGSSVIADGSKVAKYVEISNFNYRKIGFPKEKLPELNGNMFTIGGKEIILSVNEAKVVKSLLESKNSLVEYEEIGDSIWGDMDKYSLEGMAKYIERIRKKVRATGFNSQLIHTVRGKGYVLVD